jgi:hypothetical protein
VRRDPRSAQDRRIHVAAQRRPRRYIFAPW